MSPKAAWIPSLLLLTGCAGPAPLDGGQTGEETRVPCLEEREAIAWEERVEGAGQSPAEWVGSWPDGGWATELSWEDGGVEALDLQVDADPDSAVLVRREPASDGVQPEECADGLELEARLIWSSERLALDEGVLLHSEGRLAWFSVMLADPELALEAAGAALPEGQDPLVELSGALGPASSEGQLQSFGSPELPDQWVALASWEAPTD